MSAPRDLLPLASAIALALVPVLLGLTTHLRYFPPLPAMVLRGVAVSAAIAIVAWALLVVFGRASWRVAGAAVATCFGLLALYPVLAALVPPTSTTLHRIVAFWYLAVCMAAVRRVVRFQPASDSPLYAILRIFGAVIAVSFLWQIVAGYVVERTEPRITLTEPLGPLPATHIEELPDVYHVILDGFGRPDVLRARYGVDLSNLVATLRGRGFEISENEGIANYIQTALSIPSMLNASYLDADDPQATSRTPLHRLIERSAVIETFKRLGYEFIMVGSDFQPTNRHPLADVCVCPPIVVGEFEVAALKATVFGRLRLGGLDYRAHRRTARAAFAALSGLPAATRRRLVLAHIMVPHPPFVFDADGREITPPRVFSFNDGTGFEGSDEEYKAGYRAQTLFLSKAIVSVIDHLDAISRQSGREAVVILHGDHGPRLLWDTDNPERTDAEESLPVFLAIKWGRWQQEPRPQSLVNVYRSLFRRTLGWSLELLPDRGLVSSYHAPYRLIERQRVN